MNDAGGQRRGAEQLALKPLGIPEGSVLGEDGAEQEGLGPAPGDPATSDPGAGGWRALAGGATARSGGRPAALPGRTALPGG